MRSPSSRCMRLRWFQIDGKSAAPRRSRAGSRSTGKLNRTFAALKVSTDPAPGRCARDGSQSARAASAGACDQRDRHPDGAGSDRRSPSPPHQALGSSGTMSSREKSRAGRASAEEALGRRKNVPKRWAGMLPTTTRRCGAAGVSMQQGPALASGAVGGRRGRCRGGATSARPQQIAALRQPDGLSDAWPWTGQIVPARTVGARCDPARKPGARLAVGRGHAEVLHRVCALDDRPGSGTRTVRGHSRPAPHGAARLAKPASIGGRRSVRAGAGDALWDGLGRVSTVTSDLYRTGVRVRCRSADHPVGRISAGAQRWRTDAGQARRLLRAAHLPAAACLSRSARRRQGRTTGGKASMRGSGRRHRVFERARGRRLFMSSRCDALAHGSRRLSAHLCFVTVQQPGGKAVFSARHRIALAQEGPWWPEASASRTGDIGHQWKKEVTVAAGQGTSSPSPCSSGAEQGHPEVSMSTRIVLTGDICLREGLDGARAA